MKANELLLSNVRVFILESPYQTLRHSEIARSMIGKLIGVRLNAYLQDYDEGVFPLGTEDFIAHHVSVCIENNGQLTPVYSFKIMMIDKCEQLGIKHPLLSKLEDRYRATSSLQQIESFLQERQRKGATLAYFGSRSKSVEIQWEKASSILLFNVGLMSLVKASEYFKIDEFSLFGMLNKNAYQYCEMMGMNKIIAEDLIIDSLAASKAFVLHKEQFSSEAINIANKYSKLWENRIHISEEDQHSLLVKKSA